MTDARLDARKRDEKSELARQARTGTLHSTCMYCARIRSTSPTLTAARPTHLLVAASVRSPKQNTFPIGSGSASCARRLPQSLSTFSCRFISKTNRSRSMAHRQHTADIQLVVNEGRQLMTQAEVQLLMDALTFTTFRFSNSSTPIASVACMSRLPRAAGATVSRASTSTNSL